MLTVIVDIPQFFNRDLENVVTPVDANLYEKLLFSTAESQYDRTLWSLLQKNRIYMHVNKAISVFSNSSNYIVLHYPGKVLLSMKMRNSSSIHEYC